jgi:hypothetical protein
LRDSFKEVIAIIFGWECVGLCSYLFLNFRGAWTYGLSYSPRPSVPCVLISIFLALRSPLHSFSLTRSITLHSSIFLFLRSLTFSLFFSLRSLTVLLFMFTHYNVHKHQVSFGMPSVGSRWWRVLWYVWGKYVQCHYIKLRCGMPP